MGRKSVSNEKRILIAELLKQKFTQCEIASRAKVSRSLVQNISKKLKKDEHLGNRKGQGRKKITTEGEDRQLTRICKKNRRFSSRELASEWSDTIQKSVTPRTTRRRLFNSGLKSYTAKRKPFRNKRQLKIRKNWCLKYRAWSQNQWQNVVFSDESHFEVINRKNRAFVRRLPHEKNLPFNFQNRLKGGGGVISVWGCFSSAGPGCLLFYDGRLNAMRYVDTISGTLPDYLREKFSNNEYFFQQDNAPCHKARFTTNWFSEQNIPLLDWPPTSPDLNPIENIWSEIDRKLQKIPIGSKTVLQNSILDIWNNIDPTYCKKLIDSMPNRITKVLKVKGGSIHSY